MKIQIIDPFNSPGQRQYRMVKSLARMWFPDDVIDVDWRTQAVTIRCEGIGSEFRDTVIDRWLKLEDVVRPNGYSVDVLLDPSEF